MTLRVGLIGCGRWGRNILRDLRSCGADVTVATPSEIETIEIGQDMPLLLEIRAFLDHLRGGPAPMSSAEEGLIIVQRTAEIETAARSATFP